MLCVCVWEKLHFLLVSLNRVVFVAALPYYTVHRRVKLQKELSSSCNNAWAFGQRHTHIYTQSWTSKCSVCSVITSSQHGGKLQESEEPREKRIMGIEWGAASRHHAEREDAWPRQRDAHTITQEHTKMHSFTCCVLNKHTQSTQTSCSETQTDNYVLLHRNLSVSPPVSQWFYLSRKREQKQGGFLDPNKATDLSAVLVFPLCPSSTFPLIFSPFSSSGFSLTAWHSIWLPVTMANDMHKELELCNYTSVRLTHMRWRHHT